MNILGLLLLAMREEEEFLRRRGIFNNIFLIFIWWLVGNGFSFSCICDYLHIIISHFSDFSLPLFFFLIWVVNGLSILIRISSWDKLLDLLIQIFLWINFSLSFYWLSFYFLQFILFVFKQLLRWILNSLIFVLSSSWR